MTRQEAPRAGITLSGKGIITELRLDRLKGGTLKGLSPHTRSLDTIDLAIKAAAVRPEPTITVITLPAPVEINTKNTAEAPKGPDLAGIIDLNEHRGQKGLGRLRNAGRRIAAGTAAAVFGVAAFGTPVMAAADQQPSAYTVEGQIPSSNPNIVVFKDGQALSAINSSEINYAAIEQTAVSAAARYGYDTWTNDWHNWTIHENGAAATLEPDPSGLAHRVRVNGAVIDGWLKVNRPGIEAVPVVVNPRGIEYMDLQAGTFRLFPKSKRNAAFNKLVMQVRRTEKKAQPGTDVMPVCVPSHVETRWVNPAIIPSAAYAAEHYGNDPYSKLESSWEINSDGGAHFIPDPLGLSHSLKLAGVVIDAYLAINRDGTDALAIVGAPHGPGPYDKLTVTGGTVWKPQTHADLNALDWQVWRQAKAREQGPVDQGGQLGVLIVMVCN